jgi:hypothetical protein
VIAAGIGLILGIVAGPYAAKYLPLPNPSAAEIAKVKADNTRLQDENKKLQTLTTGDKTTKVDPKEREKLIADIAKLKEDANAAQGALDATNKELEEKKASLAKVEQDTQDKTAEYVKLQGEFETLDNETKITQARQRGLIAEVERLNGQVGKLEEANARSIATKDSFTHAVDRLAIQVQEASPLTPEKYNHDARVTAVNDLREKAASAPWVTPALLEAYTSMYLKEMEIASSQEYFFAKVPVTDKLGTRTRKWAECLMQGNWAVRFRTLDGENVGSFENVGTAANPQWGVKEFADPAAQREVAALIAAKRTPNFEEAVALLIEKEKKAQGSSDRQRKFDSL